MNVILVIFDSLRKDCVGCYGQQPPWGKVHTPHLDSFAKESLVMTRVYPESLPTLPARRAIYTGQRVYPFHNADYRLKGDFVGAPGWGPIPEDQATLAEILSEHGYRCGLVSDVFHMFKPSKNFWRGFHQWTFLRGQETDPQRSGPIPPKELIDRYLPQEFQHPGSLHLIRQALMNMYDRNVEEKYFAPQVMIHAIEWLQQNRDADQFFLTIESFDPHEPWFVPEYYRRMYDDTDGQDQVISCYSNTDRMRPELLRRTQANYSGEVTMCDRWFGHLYGSLRAMGLLDNTIIIVTADHGHSIGDKNYLGKRGYPSHPEVYDIPLMIRHPEGIGAGMKSDMLLMHTDITAQILDFVGIEPPTPIDGKPFWQEAIKGNGKIRDHVTVAWGPAITVVDGKWWLNCKINGRGSFLYDLENDRSLTTNVADHYPDELNRLYALGIEDARGSFPRWLEEAAAKSADAPGCSDLVPRL